MALFRARSEWDTSGWPTSEKKTLAYPTSQCYLGLLTFAISPVLNCEELMWKRPYPDFVWTTSHPALFNYCPKIFNWRSVTASELVFFCNTSVCTAIGLNAPFLENYSSFQLNFPPRYIFSCEWSKKDIDAYLLFLIFAGNEARQKPYLQTNLKFQMRL